MTAEMFAKLMWTDSYTLAPNSSGTYYASYLSDAIKLKPHSKERQKATKEAYDLHIVECGESILPYCITRIENQSISRSGRGAFPNVGILKGCFKMIESSPYKKNHPYNISTAIWKIQGYQSLYYGLPAYTQRNGAMGKDCGDLLIIHTSNWKNLDVFVFKQLGDIKYLDQVASFVHSRI